MAKLLEKLLAIQTQIDKIIKDEENKSEKYAYTSNEAVLSAVRPLMNEYKLLLVPSVKEAKLHEGLTKSGTTRFMTEIYYDMRWLDVESGEDLIVSSYAQGTDLGGERSVGKAATYNEKVFLLKFFHVPTNSDDPDSDGRTKGGEKAQRGTAAAKETAELHKTAIAQMLAKLYNGDADKAKAALIALTKNDSKQYAGVDSIDKITPAALPVVYANMKKAYQKRTGAEFVLEAKDDTEAE